MLVVVLLQPVFDLVRPDVPEPLVPALAPYFVLFEELLLRGADHRECDADRLRRELDEPGMVVCVKENVVAWEFGRIVKTVAIYGPIPLPIESASIIWPPMLKAQTLVIAELALAVRSGLKNLHGATWWLDNELAASGWWSMPTPVQRKRGRPEDRRKTGLLAMGMREAMFVGARPWLEVAPAIAAASDGEMTPKSASERMKKLRKAAPIPKHWKKTLWCNRTQPLYVNYFEGGLDSLAVRMSTPRLHGVLTPKI